MNDSFASFDRVLCDELQLIGDRRESPISKPSDDTLGKEESEKAVQEAALNANLVGLAFSGGGIRSATFNLGVLQGLATLKLLPIFDFLSTVSGGGYIGSWYAAWIKREGNLEKVQKLLNPDRVVQAKANQAGASTTAAAPPAVQDDEPDPIFHLRSYSNYLSPRLGMFSADTWAMLSSYLRNFFLNQLVILPALLAVVLIVHTAVYMFGDGTLDYLNLPGVWIVAGLLTTALIVFAFGRITMALLDLDAARERKDAPNSIRKEKGLFIQWIFTPLCLSSVLIACLFSYVIPGVTDWLLGTDPPDRAHWLGFTLFWAIAHGLAVGMAPSGHAEPNPKTAGRSASLVARIFIGLLSGAIGGAMLYLLIVYVLQEADLAMAATLGPPAVMLLFVLAAYLEVGLFSRDILEDAREWWASLCGWLLMFIVSWLVGFAVILYGPEVFAWLIAKGTWLDKDSKIVLSVLSWAGTTLAGVLAGRSSRTGGEEPNQLMEWIAVVGPFVFLTGLLILLSALVQVVIPFASIPWLALFGLIAVLAGFAFLLSWRVDVDIFSLHAFYGNRLVRCYLGASQLKNKNQTDNLRGMSLASDQRKGRRLRQPNAITGFDFKDDLHLASLRIGNPVALPPENLPEEPAHPYVGPHLIINTALNLTQGDELAWQERKAESFVLTPLWCGSRTTGYRQQPRYANDLLLGDAVALSGAAVSPLMGYHSSPAVSALLTYFNVRLGGWLGNPHEKNWEEGGPRLGWLYLLREMLGRSDQHSPFLYLSDGGHFENLGVYELVRRRCRYIVCSDADCDPDHSFEDLAGLVRKVRIDFGIRIDIELTNLRLDAVRNSKWHCAVGTIHYGDVHPGAAPGVLLYLKASLTGDEPSDVRNYADAHPPFPHQSTLDQFFTESQFESYRALGEHIAKVVFGDALVQAHREATRADDAHQLVLKEPGRLFATLRRFWFTQPPHLDEDFLSSVNGCVEFEKMLRIDPNLRQLSREVYPEESPPNGMLDSAAAEARRAEAHAVAEMLQMMENAWLQLKLDRYAALPMHRGWMSAFRRWTNAPTVRRCWPVLRGEYSQGFVLFCENELNISRICRAVRVDPANDDVKAALADLDREFVREWSGVETLSRRAEGALRDSADSPLTWLMSFRVGAPDGDWSAQDYPCGVIILHQPEKGCPPELLVWVRGPYRNQRVGRDCLNVLRDVPPEKLSQILKKNGYCRVILPDGTEADRMGQLERAMWVAFFTTYGFHQIDRNRGHNNGNKDLVMEAPLVPLFG